MNLVATYKNRKSLEPRQTATLRGARPEKLDVSERRVCRVIDQPRSTQRYLPGVREGKQQLRSEIVWLARRYGRYGYRQVMALLQREGWWVNHKRVECR